MNLLNKDMELLKTRKMLFIGACCACVSAFAQELPQGVVVYALPLTSIQLQAEATREVFTAGPYAKFAAKYLGIEAPGENRESYSLKNLQLASFVEADASQTRTVALKDHRSATNFLTMTAAGPVALFEQHTTASVAWRFANLARETDFHNRGVVSNLTKETATLYKTVKTDAGFERVPVQQSQVVEKSLERRAEETANTIYSLRRKRVELISGDADNPLSGDAMRAALEEIARLEEEYMSLFVGKSSFDTQTMTFDVVPDANQSKQLYVVFRFSEAKGLLAAANLAGRPVTLELTPEKNVKAMPSNASDTDKKGKRVSYRIPEIVQARVLDGQTELLQTRLPVYQLGAEMTFPINL